MSEFDLATQVYAAAHQVPPEGVNETDPGLAEVRSLLNRDYVHGGYTCAEIEAIQDDLIGDLNGISEALLRRGYKVNLKEHGIDHWVHEALVERRKGKR